MFPIISLWQIITFLGRGPYGHRNTISWFYKDDYLTLLHSKYKSSRTHGFSEDLCVFSHGKNMYIGANELQDGASFDHRVMIVMTYVEHYITLLHT